ncbi:leaf and flower-like protein, partial [Trifolium medium]|nr:leaf and flower-like protein [Trifolium medium]
IDDWRDIALPKELVRVSRVRSLGSNSVATGFGNEYQGLGSTGTLHRSSRENESHCRILLLMQPRIWLC